MVNRMFLTKKKSRHALSCVTTSFNLIFQQGTKAQHRPTFGSHQEANCATIGKPCTLFIRAVL